MINCFLYTIVRLLWTLCSELLNILLTCIHISSACNEDRFTTASNSLQASKFRTRHCILGAFKDP